MPRIKTKLLKGNHKILNVKERVSKKLKAKHRLLRSNHKVTSDNEGLFKTPKDNSNEVPSKPNKLFYSKKEIPLVEPIDGEKILLHKTKESSDTPKCLENNLEYENSETILINKTCKDNTCYLPAKETVNNTDTNTNTALVGNKTRKRRKPFAHINETQDYLLSPIVLLERLSIEKIKQNIFTNEEKLDSLNCSRNIDNNFSTQISENINPSKRRKKFLHGSCTKRKSQSNSESESIPTCSEKESLNQIVQEIKKNEKSVEKLISKSTLNKDNNVNESNLTENEHSQNIHTIDESESKNNLSPNKSKNEKSVNKIESEYTSKKKTEFEKNENFHNAFANRKTSLRQKNQKASIPVNTPASVNSRSKNLSEDGISQHECENEKRITECTNESIQNISISEENKNVSTNETCRNDSESEKRKTEPKNKEDQLKLENKKFQKDCTGEKIANKLKGKKEQNASTTEESLQSQNEPKNEKNKKSIEKTFISTRSKNKLENKSANEKDKNEDSHESLNESEHKNSQYDKLESQNFFTKSVSVKRRSKTEIEECQNELVKEKYSKDYLSENIEKKFENEKGQNSPIIAKSLSKHTKEKFDNNSADKKNQNTSATEKRQNESKKEKVQNKSVIEKNKSKHGTKEQSPSKRSQDKVKNDKHLNESLIEKCQNEPNNVENHNTPEKGNRHNLLENKNTPIEHNFNRDLNKSIIYNAQESITLDTIKSEIESDDADSFEENEVLNIKIFEMDNAININEDDLVSSQLKKSMRVESEPFKNNEVVNVKIFQIDKSLDIENCSSQSCVREAMENPTKTEISGTNIKLIKDKLKDIEEKKLIDSGVEKLSKTVESNIEAEKPTTSDELFNEKSKNIEEKILTETCAIIDDQEKNENEEIESDLLKNKVVIKVKIVKIDKPLEVKDSFSQFSDSKTINDQIEGEEITDGLNYELDNGKFMDTNQKISNYSPAKNVSKILKKKIEKEGTTSSSEISKGRLKISDIKDFERTTNCNEVSNDKSKEITENTLTETCAKIDDQEKNLYEKMCLQENEKMEVESEPFINNEILKIKIFENDKTLNIEDYFSEPGIEKAFEDKIESVTNTINSELNQDKLKNTEQKIIESGTKNATVNDNTEKNLTDSRSKSFIKNIQNKIKTLETSNRKDLNNSESKFTEENTLTDSSNVASKTGKDGNIEEKDIKSSSELSKEKLLSNFCEKAISSIVEDKMETEKNKSVNELSEAKSKATNEKGLIDSGSKSISKIEKKSVEAEEIKIRSEERNKIPKTTEKESVMHSSNTVKDIIEEKKIAKSNALSTAESKDKEGNTTNDLYVESVIKTAQSKNEAEKSALSDASKESKSNAIIEKSLTKSRKKDVNKIEGKNETGKSKSNVLSDGKSKVIQEKMIINSCEKIVKDKPSKSNVLSKDNSKDKEGNTTNDLYVESVIKTAQSKNEAEKSELSNASKESKSNAIKEKSLTKSRTKNVNKIEGKSETGKSKSNVLSDEKSKVNQEKMIINSCEKIVKDKPSKSNVLSKDNSKDKEGNTTNDLYVESVKKTAQSKNEAEKSELNNASKESKSNAIIEKSLTKSRTKNVNKIEGKSETGKSKSNVLSDEKSKVNQEINSCKKSVSNIVKDKSSKSNLLNKDKSKDKEGNTANDFYVQSVIKTVQAKIEAEKSAKNVNKIEGKNETGKSKSNVLSDGKSKVIQEKMIINSCEKSVSNIVKDNPSKSNVLSKDKSKDKEGNTANDFYVQRVIKTVQAKIEAEKSELINTSKESKSNVNKIVEDKSKARKSKGSSKGSNSLRDEKSEASQEKTSVNLCIKSTTTIVEDKTVKRNELSKSKCVDNDEKTANSSCTKSVSKLVQNKIETEKTDTSNDLSEMQSTVSNKKSLIDSCTKRVSIIVEGKIETGQSKSRNALSDKKAKDTAKEKFLIDTYEKNFNKTMKDKIEAEKTEKRNILNEGILIDINKKTLPHSCTKSVSKPIKDKIEAEKTTMVTNSQNKKLDDKEKVIVETCSNTVNKKIEEMKVKSSELNEEKSKDTNKKSLIDSYEQNVTKSVKDKNEGEKTAKDNVLSKNKSKDINEKTLPNSCINSVGKTKNDKIELEKTATDNDSLNKKVNDFKEKVTVKSCLKTVSITTIKEKNVEEKRSNDELKNDKSRATKEKSLIDSFEKDVNESVKDNIARSTVLNKDKSEDTNKKTMPDICVKSVSKTRKDKIAVEKTIIDDNLRNIKENVSIDSAEIVSESVKDKIETQKFITSNNASNEKKELKSTGEKLLRDSGPKSASNITRDKIYSEKARTKEVSVDKSKDDEGKSLADSCEKTASETLNNKIDEQITTHNSCIEVTVLHMKETLKSKTSNVVSDKLQNAEEETLPDANKKTDVSDKNIGQKENEVESCEELSVQQENNSVTACTLKSVTKDRKSSKKSKKKKPNKYRRLKKHMIRKRRKKNRVKISGNELIKTKSSKMMELLGTICRNKIQDKSQDSERIVKPIKIKLSNPVNESVRNKFSTLVNESVRKTFSTSVDQSVHNKLSIPVKQSTCKQRYRDPVTGKFCSKPVEKSKTSLDMITNKSVPARSEVIENTAGLKKNKSVPVNSKEMGVSNELAPSNSKVISGNNKKLFCSSANSSISNRFKSPDTRKNINTTQLSNSNSNFSNQNSMSAQAVENVVQEEITIEEHEIKIEEDPEVLEIIVSEEEASNINYVTASEIFSGINPRTNKTTSRAEVLKNLRSILPLNKGSSLLRTNCINVNNEQNSVLECIGEISVSDNTNRNLHRYTEQPSKSRASLPSQHLYNQNSRNINIISDDSSNDGLYNNDHGYNYHSINIQDHSFNNSVASTSTNSNNTMSISVREAYEKISSDLLGAYDPQSEIDPQDYSNGINDLLHISDSDDDQMSDNNDYSNHNVDHSVTNQHNYQLVAGDNSSQHDNQSNVFYQKSVKKKAVDETMHMLLQCPRCLAECLGMKRLQRHYSKCGVPALFTCTICQTKLKQKRSLATHYLSYHADLVSEDTLPDVIAETVKRSTDARNLMMRGKYITLPSHVSVFCDRCQATYRMVPESHRLSCQRCLQPLTSYCEKCKRRQMLSLRVQIHAQAKCSERPCCPHCGLEADTPSRLHEHVAKQHSSNQVESLTACRHGCGLSFRQQHSRQRHEAHCAKEKDQLCRFCPFKTKHRSVIKVHMQQHMINNEISPAQAATVDRGTTDEVSQQIEAYCQMCRGVFETPVSSGTRCPRCHGGALYRCRRCSAADTVYREMRRHVHQSHVHQSASRGRPRIIEWPCRLCGECFDDTLALRRHQRAAGGCQPRCRRCSKTFVSASSLKRHLDLRCGVAPGLHCEHCTFVTRNRFSIVRHMQTQHADVYNGSRLTCPKCGLVFNNIYLYDTHVEIC